MISSITNHLWQSTAFAVAAGLLTIVLRRNRARVRYWVWLCASAKFLIPFSILIGLGSLLPVNTPPAPRTVAFTAVQIAEPFSQPLLPPVPLRNSHEWVPSALAAVWICGFVAMAMVRFRGWSRIRAAIRASVPAGIASGVEVRSSAGLLEPGVVGLFRSILLLPEGIAERLTPAQLEAVLAHELSHVRRRDNLTGAMHMLVEAVFWFHPLVWWIGARLIEERELACDEAVLDLGSQPRDYADAILGVVKLYAESPIACVAGVTGSNLKKRIEAIMNKRAVFGLNFPKKATLAVAGFAAIAAPVGIGVVSVRPMIAQQPPAPQPRAPAAPAISTPERPADLSAPRGIAFDSAGNMYLTPAGRAMVYQGKNKTFYFFQQTPVSAAALDSPSMINMRARYGAPNQIEERNSGTERASVIWRYNYLEDFHSNVEFEFSGPKGGIHVNWPPPLATFEGKPAIAEELADHLNQETQATGGLAQAPVAGLLGEHAEMQTYPSAVPQWLVLPIVPLAGRFDVVAEIRSSGGVVATVRDRIALTARPDGAAMGHYRASFTLAAGAYNCDVALRDPNGQIYTEAIAFEVK